MQRSLVSHASPSHRLLPYTRTQLLWRAATKHIKAQTNLSLCLRSAAPSRVTITAATGFGSGTSSGSINDPSKTSKSAGNKKGKKLHAVGNVKQSRKTSQSKKDTTPGKSELVRQLAFVQGRTLPQAPPRTPQDESYEELLKQLQVAPNAHVHVYLLSGSRCPFISNFSLLSDCVWWHTHAKVRWERQGVQN